MKKIKAEEYIDGVQNLAWKQIALAVTLQQTTFFFATFKSLIPTESHSMKFLIFQMAAKS